jgi:integrase
VNKIAIIGSVRRSLDDREETFRLLVESWLSDKTDSTKQAYTEDLRDFQRWVGAPSSFEMMTQLFALSTAQSYQVVDQYRLHLLQKGIAGSKINRRLAVLRTLSRRAVAAGICDAPIINEGIRNPGQQDMPMVENADWKRLLSYLQTQLTPPGTNRERLARRDLAVVRLLRDVGLRRKEVLTAVSVDVARKTLRIQPKGPKGMVLDHPVAGEAWECLLDWLEIRPDGPMFKFKVLTSLNHRLTTVCERAGLPHLTPHMFRRSGITGAIDHFGARSREAQDFSRQKDPKMLELYDKKHKHKAIREAQEYLGKDEPE